MLEILLYHYLQQVQVIRSTASILIEWITGVKTGHFLPAFFIIDRVKIVAVAI